MSKAASCGMLNTLSAKNTIKETLWGHPAVRNIDLDIFFPVVATTE